MHTLLQEDCKWRNLAETKQENIRTCFLSQTFCVVHSGTVAAGGDKRKRNDGEEDVGNSPPYQKIAKILEGGFIVVNDAEHIPTPAIVAKEIQLSETEGNLHLAEVALLKRLNHENVVKK